MFLHFSRKRPSDKIASMQLSFITVKDFDEQKRFINREDIYYLKRDHFGDSHFFSKANERHLNRSERLA